jgi:hypothetical protein
MVLDANSEASEAVVEWQEVTNEVAELQTVEALEDWFWNLHLAIRYPCEPKKESQGNGGSRQNLAAAQIQTICHAVPVLFKERNQRKPSRGNFARGTSEWSTFLKI